VVRYIVCCTVCVTMVGWVITVVVQTEAVGEDPSTLTTEYEARAKSAGIESGKAETIVELVDNRMRRVYASLSCILTILPEECWTDN
jgi:hypothetical protein